MASTRTAFEIITNRLHVEREAGRAPARWTFTRDFFERLMTEDRDSGTWRGDSHAKLPETVLGLPYEIRELRYGQTFALDADEPGTAE